MRGRTHHHPRTGTKGVKKGSMGVKTFEKADTPSKKGCIGSQDPRQGGHTLKNGYKRRTHQGGHLKIALRTPNNTLFGEKMLDFSMLHFKRANRDLVSIQKTSSELTMACHQQHTKETNLYKLKKFLSSSKQLFSF